MSGSRKRYILFEIENVIVPLAEIDAHIKSPEDRWKLSFVKNVRLNPGLLMRLVELAVVTDAKVATVSAWPAHAGEEMVAQKFKDEAFPEELWHEDWFIDGELRNKEMPLQRFLKSLPANDRVLILSGYWRPYINEKHFDAEVLHVHTDKRVGLSDYEYNRGVSFLFDGFQERTDGGRVEELAATFRIEPPKPPKRPEPPAPLPSFGMTM